MAVVFFPAMASVNWLAPFERWILQQRLSEEHAFVF